MSEFTKALESIEESIGLFSVILVLFKEAEHYKREIDLPLLKKLCKEGAKSKADIKAIRAIIGLEKQGEENDK